MTRPLSITALVPVKRLTKRKRDNKKKTIKEQQRKDDGNLEE
jgi:hypothetical protein